VQDEKAPERMSAAEEEIVKEKESKRILKHIRDTSYIISLAIEGKQRTSEELANHIEKLGVLGKSDITFIIGGSLGLSKDVLSKSHEKLSFSNMTFPHQLMRVILLEQIYRSYRIINNQPYHK
jgi:23S rRNA (pseudouridine1915-N3)-methyltransferase